MAEECENYELVEPFDIDDGSLEGIAAKEAFTLGVEWLMFRRRLQSGQPFKVFCFQHYPKRVMRQFPPRPKRDRPRLLPLLALRGVFCESGKNCSAWRRARLSALNSLTFC